MLRSGSNRRTAIFDAAAKALTAFDQLPRVRSERHIVILISDGLDNASIAVLSVIEIALKKRVSVYVIHLPLFEPRDGRLGAYRREWIWLLDPAEKTRGKYFVADPDRPLAAPKNDLTPIFAIDEDLQHSLGFYIAESARRSKA